jgi:L-seryl-tRNA(Ser) seleniumtransferase
MKPHPRQDFLRKIPSVEELLKTPEIKELCTQFPRATVISAVQRVLAETRRTLLSRADNAAADEEGAVSLPAIQYAVTAHLQKINMPSLQRVINATGVVVHTNLGRAPLAENALRLLTEPACRYNNLEFDLEKGERGSRITHVRELLRQITGARDAFAVNNNAAAVLLCLSTLARGREVLISRGELIEIGGSFRIPEVMEQSGARLREVGTTNRTHLSDYRQAITENTALILKVHSSNYKMVGFTAEVSLREMKQLGTEFHLPVMFDMGSGNLLPPEQFGLQDEPTVQEALQQGADIITFSGDKLVGGPQAGIILGDSGFITAISRHPLTRALRLDKLTLAALEATLRLYYLDPDCTRTIPVLSMISVAESTLKKRARAIARALRRNALPLDITVVPDCSKIGGGSYPLHDLPTWAVALAPQTMSPEELERRLRTSTPPVMARINRERVILDMRTLFPEEAGMVSMAIVGIFTGGA